MFFVQFFSSTCKFEKESKVRRNWRYDDLYNMIHLKKKSKLKKESKVWRNWRYDDFYNMIHFNNVNIELIENFPYDNDDTLICKKNKSLITRLMKSKYIKWIKMNKYVYKKKIHIYYKNKKSLNTYLIPLTYTFSGTQC